MYRYLMITFILVVSLPCAGRCSTSDWSWNFAGYVYAGTITGASDGLDSLDVPMPEEPFTSHIAIYEESGINGWNDANGFYRKSYRAPLGMTPGSSKTWRLYVWGDTNYPGSKISINWFGDPSTDSALHDIEFRLTYVRSAVGIIDNHINTVGSYRILNDHPDGATWGPFPTVRTDNGLDGYIFDLTATVVPEPGSLFALSIGLISVVWRLRRRRG